MLPRHRGRRTPGPAGHRCGGCAPVAGGNRLCHVDRVRDELDTLPARADRRESSHADAPPPAPPAPAARARVPDAALPPAHAARVPDAALPRARCTRSRSWTSSKRAAATMLPLASSNATRLAVGPAPWASPGFVRDLERAAPARRERSIRRRPRRGRGFARLARPRRPRLPSAARAARERLGPRPIAGSSMARALLSTRPGLLVSASAFSLSSFLDRGLSGETVGGRFSCTSRPSRALRCARGREGERGCQFWDKLFILGALSFGVPTILDFASQELTPKVPASQGEELGSLFPRLHTSSSSTLRSNMSSDTSHTVCP